MEKGGGKEKAGRHEHGELEAQPGALEADLEKVKESVLLVQVPGPAAHVTLHPQP